MTRHVATRRGKLLHLHFHSTDLAALLGELREPGAALVDHLADDLLLGGAINLELKVFLVESVNVRSKFRDSSARSAIGVGMLIEGPSSGVAS